MLGEIRRRRSDIPGARDALRAALDKAQSSQGSAKADVVLAAQLLGEVLAESGDLDGALRTAKTSAETPVSAAVAMASLGLVLRDSGHIADACRELRGAVDMTIEPVASTSALELAALLVDQGDMPGAGAAYARAAESPIAEEALYAPGMLTEYERQGHYPAPRRIPVGCWPLHEGPLPATLPGPPPIR